MHEFWEPVDAAASFDEQRLVFEDLVEPLKRDKVFNLSAAALVDSDGVLDLTLVPHQPLFGEILENLFPRGLDPHPCVWSS